MTVCIVAYSARANAIVAVSDWLLSNEHQALDGVPKFAPLHRSGAWFVQFSGDDVPEFESLRAKIVTRLDPTEWPSYEEVLAAMEAACMDERRETGDRLHVMPLGYANRSEFLRTGLTDLGDRCFEAHVEQLGQVQLQTELMVFGFDREGRGYLASSNMDGRVSRRNTPPVFAIGTGKWAAEVSLFLNPDVLVDSVSVEPIVYWLCAAKFAAQAATRSVGERTLAMIVRPGNIDVLFDDQLRTVRESWETAARAIPESAIVAIGDCITWTRETRRAFLQARAAEQQSDADPQ